MFDRIAIVKSKYGIHARPSAAICTIAKKYPGTKIVLIDPVSGTTYDTVSILEILTINKKEGDSVIVRASGTGEIDAVNAIVLLIETYEVED